ncbi:lysine--tRNA ligase [Spiroplasma turonicum]|uniref:Lysine--tRNA ligase n=1 Tax=Spiroplasma turonicum TaxID=216946 RepID=A0A0K1P4Q9_9MOLU|nr:lysine--tRNA ligase [Spiroplasma turonicum]AKU79263.1 lysyl-tRNA synthetase [Spiroplasma turonicum]ALX70286.1 lysyl-tRNA synthetase [Spiroplasma turonicum]
MKNNFDRNFSEQELVRRKKLESLINSGKDPYVENNYDRTHMILNIIEEFDNFSKEDLVKISAGNIISTAGRIRLFREAGKKAIFANIQDQDALIQLYVREDEIGEENFIHFKDLDLGDIIGVKGIMMKTDHGELTIRVKEYTLLTKALKPLPDKYAGITDIEEKYRRRYVDLIVNPETKEVFKKRSKVIRTIQSVLDEKGYMEVETPILHLIKAGGDAKPFVTHYNALDTNFYLRIATELHLKRCIVGGFEGVYEIGRLFRNEGMSTRHNPEFTSIEIYVAYKELNFLMNICEEIFRTCALKVNGTTKVNYAGIDFDFSKPFKRWHMVDAIKEVCGVDFWKKMTYDEAKKLADTHKLKYEKYHFSVGHIINLFFEHYVEDKIIEPTFIIGHPKEISPLSKLNKDDNRFTDRFELFINKREYANAFAELNNPIDQYERFLDQIKQAEAGDEEASELDIDFIEALEYGMPPTAGIGIGIDRLVMLLTNSDSIKDVLLFPQLRPRGN